MPGNYYLNYTLTLAKRFAQKGYYIYLDYHFSDHWADSQRNNAPLAWPTDLVGLSATLRNYVKDTIVAFSDAGVNLSIVSLGNEIRNGMLWPLGRVNVDLPEAERVANFTNLATLYRSARYGVDDAVKSGAQRPQLMIHINNGWNQTLQESWFGALTATGKVSRKDWDIFGFSSYPFYGVAATLGEFADLTQRHSP